MRPILFACLMVLVFASHGKAAPFQPLTASKTFAPSTVTPGSITRISISATNPNGGPVSLTSVVDTLPASIVLANPINATFSAACPPNLVANAPGSAAFNYQAGNADLGAGATCTISFDVVAPAIAGKFTNTAIVLPEDSNLSPNPQPSAILCVTASGNRRQQTVDRMKTFMHRRADLLLEEEPDRNRLLRRLAVSEGGQGTDAGLAAGLTTPFNMLFTENGGARKLSFSTSLKKLAHASSTKMARAMALGPEGSFAPAVLPRDGIDIWVEGHYTHFEDDIGQGDRSGHLGVLYVGADHVIRPWLLIGALAQFDWAEDDSTRLGSNVTGTGWMAGPYITARLHKNVFFDARGAWGKTDNDIDIVGITKDSFDTRRWLAVVRLTGDWWRGAFRITPSASVKYIEDEQESFTNSLGTFIPGQTVSLGRFKFGPEFGYRYDAVDGTRIEPHVSIEGIWDFDNAGPLAIAGIVTSANDVRAKVEGGVMLTRPGGVGVRATGAYDGIADDDFSAYSGKLWVNMPLN